MIIGRKRAIVMPQFKKLRLILGDQLNEDHTWFKTPEKDVTYLMMEVRQETDYVKHHIQKVAAFFAAMRAFAERISLLGHHIIYLKLDDSRNRQNLADNITDLLHKIKPEYFEYLLPDEHRLDIQLHELADKFPIPFQAVDTEHTDITAVLIDHGKSAATLCHDMISRQADFIGASEYRRIRIHH